jgi:hypothetical protein
MKAKQSSLLRRVAGWSLGIGLVASPFALADDINSGGITTKGVAIEKITTEKDPASGEIRQILNYKTQTGNPGTKTISDKMRLTITDEPNLNAGEDAFANGKWADAADFYQKTLKATNKPWLKDYAATRLLKSSEQSNRVDSAVIAYLYVLGKDAQAAQAMKPKLPDDPNNAYLKTAAKLVDDAIATEHDQAKALTLKAFRMDIARAMKDSDVATKLAGELSKAGGTTGTPTPGADPSTLMAVIDGKLDLIRTSIEKKDYQGARKALDDARESIVEPKHEAEWLFLNAEDQAGIAGDTKDETTLKNLAIDYMRVVANFPQSPRASESLLKTAAIMEKLNDAKSALTLYQQVARDYDGQPAGADAKKSVARLGGK